MPVNTAFPPCPLTGRSVSHACPAGHKALSIRLFKSQHSMKAGYWAPISLHAEYLEDNVKDAAALKGFREAHLRDMKTLHQWLGWV